MHKYETEYALASICKEYVEMCNAVTAPGRLGPVSREVNGHSHRIFYNIHLAVHIYCSNQKSST